MSFVKQVLFISFIFCFLTSFSQQSQKKYIFEPIEEEFTQSAITSIMRDLDGFTWIGTYGDGLFKYNSVDFKNYKENFNSLEGALKVPIIYTTFQDSKKNIWIGSDKGLHLYKSDLDTFENIVLKKNNKSINYPVHTITEYDQNTILIGTHQYGLYKYNKETGIFKNIKFKNDESTVNLQINAIVKSANGRFLVGTNKGLMTFNPYDEKLLLANFNTQGKTEVIENSIESLLIDKDKSIWAGTFSSGLFKITSNKRNIYSISRFPITQKRIMSLAERQNSNILCATENDGLFEIEYKNDRIENFKQNKLNEKGLKSNSIWTVYTDDKDRIWLGYYNNGIDIYDDIYNKFNSIKSTPYLSNSLNSSSVTGISKDKKGRFWISMFDGGVDVYDKSKNEFTNLFDQKNSIAKGLDRLDITTIFIDSKNNIWVGTWNSGLYLLKNKSKKFMNINASSANSILKSNRVMSFAEDSKGIIWIGTFLSGLYSFNPSLDEFIHHNSENFLKYNINSSDIRKVLVDSNDFVWIGTRVGVYLIKKYDENEFEVISLNDKMAAKSDLDSDTSKKQSIVFSLFEDSNSNIWIGTLGDGLAKYNPKANSIKRFDRNNGLIHETIFSIVESDSGMLWFGGNKGLSKFNTNTQEFTNFNKTDGLLSNSFNYNAVFNDNDTLYFGNPKGINFFNPNQINYNKEKPVVFLSDLKFANDLVIPNQKNSPLKKVLAKTKKLTLHHNQNVFSLDYFGINYTRSENNQYAYYLKGYDDDWNYVGNSRRATYKNIPPGNYSFLVKASNNDGVWNDIPTALEIEVLPAWWITNGAILTYFLLVSLFIFFIYKYIITRVKERRELSLERQKYKQFQALNAKKIQFFTNISHEFRTPLTLILTPLEDLIEGHNNSLSNEVIEKHNIIYKNAKRLSRLINELMDFRKLQFNKLSINASQINLVPFVKEVVSHFEEEAILKNISLNVEHDSADLLIWSDPSMLEKIIFNLLSNAFKASSIKGLITIEIKNAKDLILLPLVDTNKPVEAVEIIVKDTGVGIEEKDIPKVFDRFYQGNESNGQYYGGTGIGLEMVKNFVDLNKGKIILTSKKNVGTQFKIYLPLGYNHLKENTINTDQKEIFNQYSDSKKSELNTELKEDKDIENKKIILIVDDNVELRNYIKNELKGDYTIKEAENGLEGLEKANKYMPDLIISDVMMPIMDGFEFCERIKSDIKTSHIPILMVTAKGMQIDKLKGIDSGADVYLNKPFNMKVLKSHLKQLITSRQILFDKYFNGVHNSIIAENSTSLDKEFMNTVLTYINDNLSDEKLNVEHLANQLFLSRSKLYRKIKALTGDTANEFIRKVRLEKAKQIIEQSDLTISEVCYKVGFSSPSYFTKCFKDYFGVLPTNIK